MGETAVVQDQLLVVFPFPEPKPLLDGMRRDYPALNIVYYMARDKDAKDRIMKESDVIPKGKGLIHTFHFSSTFQPPSLM